MKTNRDQLNHALHHLRGDTLSEAFSAMETPSVSHAVHHRRWMAATAACLSVVFLLGAVVGIPMMRADEAPLDTPPATQSAPSPEELSYYSTPTVRLDQLSATETATISDPSIPTEKIQVQVNQTQVFDNYYALLFDCLPGETITIRSGTDCLGLIDMKYNPNASLEERDAFAVACDSLRHYSSSLVSSNQPFKNCVSELTFDPSVSSVVIYFRYTNPEDYVDEDILLYTISNEEGQITGAGGMYVGRKYFRLSNGPGASRHLPAITRAALLDSVRFTNPAAVTEEQVETLLESFAEKGKDGRNMVDFSPVTSEERLNAASLEIQNTVLADENISGGGRLVGCYTDYAFYTAHLADSETSRHFIIFKDGTWAELDYTQNERPSSNGHENAECPLTEKYGYHGVGEGCLVKTTDGRLYYLEEYDVENIERTYTAILIYDPAA